MFKKFAFVYLDNEYDSDIENEIDGKDEIDSELLDGVQPAPTTMHYRDEYDVDKIIGRDVIDGIPLYWLRW